MCQLKLKGIHQENTPVVVLPLNSLFWSPLLHYTDLTHQSQIWWFLEYFLVWTNYIQYTKMKNKEGLVFKIMFTVVKRMIKVVFIYMYPKLWFLYLFDPVLEYLKNNIKMVDWRITHWSRKVKTDKKFFTTIW